MIREIGTFAFFIFMITVVYVFTPSDDKMRENYYCQVYCEEYKGIVIGRNLQQRDAHIVIKRFHDIDVTYGTWASDSFHNLCTIGDTVIKRKKSLEVIILKPNGHHVQFNMLMPWLKSAKYTFDTLSCN